MQNLTADVLYCLCLAEFATNVTCGDLIIYHPINDFRSTFVTWSDASESCKGTGGRLLPANIQANDKLFTCVSKAMVSTFERYLGSVVTPNIHHDFVWTDQKSSNPIALCNAVGLDVDEKTISINCETSARYMCVRGE